MYYSPASTVLAGREQIYITAGFNRWGHLKTLGPAAMKPPGPEGLHHRVGGWLFPWRRDRSGGGPGARGVEAVKIAIVRVCYLCLWGRGEKGHLRKLGPAAMKLPGTGRVPIGWVG